MRVIETEYKGYLFRSRLEAKWAVFFDACGVKWEYEPEGFDLGGGFYYLPDFLLHDVIIKNNDKTSKRIKVVDLWVEVKGKMTDEDEHKILCFAGDHSEGYYFEEKGIYEYPVIVLQNIPDGDNFREIWNYITYVADYPKSRVKPFNFETIDQDEWTAYPCIDNQGNFSILGSYDLYNADAKATEQAYRLARQARFEHGKMKTIRK